MRLGLAFQQLGPMALCGSRLSVMAAQRPGAALEVGTFRGSVRWNHGREWEGTHVPIYRLDARQKCPEKS